MAFTISGFTDEINKDFDIQMTSAKKHGLTHIELRGIDGISVGTFDKESIQSIKKKLDENGIGVPAIGSPIEKSSLTHICIVRVDAYIDPFTGG